MLLQLTIYHASAICVLTFCPSDSVLVASESGRGGCGNKGVSHLPIYLQMTSPLHYSHPFNISQRRTPDYGRVAKAPGTRLIVHLPWAWVQPWQPHGDAVAVRKWLILTLFLMC